MTPDEHDPTLPPIMRLPGLRCVAMGTDQKGRFFIKFITHRKRIPEIVLFLTNMSTEATFAYMVVEELDDHVLSVSTHVGPHGDPTKDPRDDTFLWP